MSEAICAFRVLSTAKFRYSDLRNIVNCIECYFKDDPGIDIKVSPITEKRCPLMRQASLISPRSEEIEEGYVMTLTYNEKKAKTDTTLFFTGVGICYKPGVAIQRDGNEFLGAASIVSFFKALSLLKPRGLRVIGLVGFYCNTNCCTAHLGDQDIKTRDGIRVVPGHMDWDGQMVVADLLSEAKSRSRKAVNPHLFSVMSLPQMSHITLMDNGTASRNHVAAELKAAGEKVSEIVEVSHNSWIKY